MTTRRNILKSGAGLAAILATGKAPAALVKSMLAARKSFWISEGNKEEEMYKELFEQFVTNTFPSGSTLTIPYRTFRQLCFTAIVVDTLEFTNLQSADLYGNNHINNLASDYGGGNNSARVRVLKFPAFTYWGYYYMPILSPFYGLEDLYIPNVTSFQASDYGFHGSRGNPLHVHIDKTCADIRAIPNFPGFGTASLALDKIVFVGTDGTVAWDGSEWAYTPSAQNGGEYNLICLWCAYTRSSRPSARCWRAAA